MSRDPDNAFFTDGVQDQILTALAKVADLKVISRTSVMQYKTGTPRNTREIGQQLGVAHLLEGTVQRAGNKVRVNAQLIDVRTDGHEWADNYDRPIDDVFAIQSEIAKAIADQLQAKLSPKEKNAIEQAPTRDLVAFDLYSRAKSLMITTSFSAIGGQNLAKPWTYSNRRSHVIRRSSSRSASSLTRMITFTSSESITPRLVWRPLKPRSKQRFVCNPTQERHTSPAPNIFIVAISTTMERWLNWKSPVNRYRTTRAFSS